MKIGRTSYRIAEDRRKRIGGKLIRIGFISGRSEEVGR
jgi:hypothetical protein